MLLRDALGMSEEDWAKLVQAGQDLMDKPNKAAMIEDIAGNSLLSTKEKVTLSWLVSSYIANEEAKIR